MIISRNNCGLILPRSRDDVDQMNYASYQFNSEEKANIYLCNLSKAVKLYNEQIRYKNSSVNNMSSAEWVEIQ